MTIHVENISKSYGAFRALENVSLDVPPGELTALLGPSGSGKTTLLRIIAGLESPDSGTIRYERSDVTKSAVRERNVGFVFQHYALFGHMTIFENIAFGLRVRKWKKDAVNDRVTELLKLIQLEGLGKRFPSQLSGGQRQRVALARALAPQPQILLLDEPFGALDAKVRQELRRWLRRLHDEIGMTSLFVTHDQEEAFEVADRVVVMNKGHIEQNGAPNDVFAQPANAFVMDFLGNVNVFHGRAEAGRVQAGGFELPFPEYSDANAQPATAYVRPHEMDIDRKAHGPQSFEARVARINRSGPLVKLSLIGPDGHTQVNAEIDHGRDRELNLSVDETVYLYPHHVRVFLPANGTLESTGVENDKLAA
jgi:sulfate transport system ATP-binding protein